MVDTAANWARQIRGIAADLERSDADAVFRAFAACAARDPSLWDAAEAVYRGHPRWGAQ